MSVQGRPGFLGGPSNRRAGYHRVTWESGAYSYVHESEIMPRPKPSEPWINIALRLTPAQAAKVQQAADNAGCSRTDALRHMIDSYEVMTVERRGEIMREITKQVEAEAKLGRPKAKPGSLLKKR